MITLYSHQEDSVDDIRNALRAHNSVLFQGSTGIGKTIITSYIAKSATTKDKRVMFTVHRKDLITQTAKTFDKFKIDYGYIASGLRSDPYQAVQIASIQTLTNRYLKLPVPDVMVVDESHLAIAKTWAKVISYYKSKGCKIVGLTATPWRLSGEGLGSLFDTMVQGPSMAWLIEHGYLSDYKIFAPSQPDLSGVHSRMGDYVKKELETAMDKPTITGDAITHWMKLAKGKRTLAFCVSTKHSQHVAEQFRANGIPAIHIGWETSQEDRMKVFEAFADGRIEVITSVSVFSEGFDLSAQVDREVPIEAAIFLRPTQSLTLYLQQAGRPLRRKPYPAIMLDHAGNTLKHGLPDEDREWTLEGHKRSGRKQEQENLVSIRQCPKCYFVHEPLPICPNCGHKYTVAERMPEVTDGELVEIDKARLQKSRKYEEYKCETLEDWVALGKARGYVGANAWARKRFGLREERKRGVRR